MKEHKFPYLWKLTDGYPAPGIEKHGKKVFSTFACGGGSTMGYKMAGYDVIGAEDIDPKMAEIYVANHHPKMFFQEGIVTFKDRTDLPRELYELDILDGSPPCTSFSDAGLREEGWGKEKKFAEGQTVQILDTLFFDFIELAKKLQPKVIIAENVYGLLKGNAREYVKRIFKAYDNAGYKTAYYVLQAEKMGVPQMRRRVFFISIRNDLILKVPHLTKDLFSNLPVLDMDFSEPLITYREIEERDEKDRLMGIETLKLWKILEVGQFMDTVHPRGSRFNVIKMSPDKPIYTLTTHTANYLHYEQPRTISNKEMLKASSFPMDFNPCKKSIGYVCGMSVPPVMMAQVANQVYEQVLKYV